MTIDVSNWLLEQENGLNIIKTKSSRSASFSEYEDRVCMNRSINELRKICIGLGDNSGEALCVSGLKSSVKKLYRINEKKYKIRQKLETEINQVI